MLLTILIILLLFALLFPGWGYSRYGPYSWGPLGLILVVLLLAWLLGLFR